MSDKSSLAEALTQILDEDVIVLATALRSEGHSYAEVAHRISLRAGMRVSTATVARWVRADGEAAACPTIEASTRKAAS